MILIWIFEILFLSWAQGSPLVELESYVSHSRVVFRIDPGIEPKFTASPKGFLVELPNTEMVDLGSHAELGANLSDARVGNLKVWEKGRSVWIEGKWKFPHGDNAPAHPVMETFQFKRKNPYAYVVDFWLKKGPTVAQVRAEELQKKKEAALRQSEKEAKKKADRRLASMQKDTENADPAKFCKEPLRDNSDIFIPFRPIHPLPDFGRWFSTTTPDVNYPYLEPKTDAPDANYARLALKLARDGKPGLALKTIELFERDFPKSNFRTDLQFLKANSLIKLGLTERAKRVLQDITYNEKGSPVALHSRIFLATQAFINSEYVASLEHFLTLIQDYPRYRLTWVFHLGAAESLYYMKQTDRAAKEYKWIVDNAEDPKARIEASARIGDLYLERKQYAQALAAYYRTFQTFPKAGEVFPDLVINRAESLYWLGQVSRAEEEFKLFLDKNPTHPEGWRASLRLAEIAGRREPRETSEEYKQWLLVTMNRYPFTPGSLLAQMQISQCGDHAGLSKDLIEELFVREAPKFNGKDTLFTEEMNSLILLGFSRSLVTLGEESRAVEIIVPELPKIMASAYRPVFLELLVLGFTKHLQNYLAGDKKLEAITFFKNYWDTLPKEAPAVDRKLLLQLSMAAADLQLGAISLNLISLFEEANKKEVGNREIASQEDELSLDARLRQSEEAFARAKALWVSHGTSAADKIKIELAKVTSESPYSAFARVIEGLVEQKKGNNDLALKNAIEAALLLPNEWSDIRVQLTVWIAELYTATGNRLAALKTYETLPSRLNKQEKDKKTISQKQIDAISIVGLPPVPNSSQLGILKADLYEKEKMWGEAAAQYESVIGDGLTDDRTQFALARVLRMTKDQKNLEKAKQILDKIVSESKNGFWKQLAQEALENQKLGVN